ncbi:diguanylate cyclase [Spiroplasma eriocheiris]|uniref:Diguanylate cyclase n=2 Tax=Spiroplasma eriocheiris TaxID=315358 RepID=A0A0H3XIR4_9MOLU|nr:putative dipeptidase PepV [Spiroplasma eriocheiris CCTCC M 207170]AKM53631.1 diguanylate cyclase [Spiroplasma eriocheiris]
MDNLIKKEIIKNNDKFLEDLITFLKINTVKDGALENMPFGKGVARGLAFLLNWSKQQGFTVINLNEMIGYLEYGESEEYIAVLGHLDVVLAGNNWVTDPFEPVIMENKIYARGALDDKGPLFANLYAIKILKDLGYYPKTKIRIIFGTDEESRGLGINYYNSKEKPPIMGYTPDSVFPVVFAEKGIFTYWLNKKNNNFANQIFNLKGGERSNVVPDYCEVTLKNLNFDLVAQLNDFLQQYNTNYQYQFEIKNDNGSWKIQSHGITAHASTPEEGNNAIHNLLKLITWLPLVHDDNYNFIKFIANNFTYDGAKMNCQVKNTEMGDLTMSLGLIEQDDKVIKCKFNVRYPQNTNMPDLITRLTKIIDPFDIYLSEENDTPALYFSKTTPMIQILHNTYQKVTGYQDELVPSKGSTYAKLMPNIVAFGATFPGEETTEHQPNEFIDLQKLFKAMEIYANAMIALSK